MSGMDTRLRALRERAMQRPLRDAVGTPDSEHFDQVTAKWAVGVTVNL